MKNKFPTFVAIESAVLLDDRISNTDKIAYGVICALSNNDENQCYASTEYLCELIQIKPRQLRYSLSHLIEYHYILVSFKGNKRYIKPTINKFIEIRKSKPHKQIDLFNYDWLNEE